VTRERPGVTIDVFAASVMRAVPNRLNIPEPGTHVYGVNIALARVLPCVTLEPYVFARRAPNQALELGGRDALHSATIGGRWTVATRTAFDIGGEMAGQLGSIGDGPIRAWAGHRTVGFTDASFAWKPRVFAEYNYASAMTTRTMDDGRRSISCTDRPRQARSRRSGGLEERAPSPDWNRSAPGAPPRRHRPVSLVVADNDNRCAV
jgi:hypothetical protein